MDGVAGRPGNGPASASAYAGNFIAGTIFKVTANGLWLTGYRNWVPSNGDTVAKKFALWQLTAGLSVSQQLVPNSVVTSGVQTAGAWNFTALPAPINLSGSVPYVCAIGWVSVNGFPDTQNQFGSGQTYAAGITNGPLFAYSDQGASAPEPFTSNYSQGLFGTSTADPSVTMPTTGDVHSNFWVDVQVSDQAPGNAAYQLWPSQPYAINYALDAASNFTLGTEIVLAQSCALNKIWFYSPATVTQLPTRCGVWTVPGGTLYPGTDQPSPSWSGAAGSGWISQSYSGVVLPAGKYRVSVFNGAGVPAVWSADTSVYWSTGPGGSGITNGPLSAPNSASADSPGQSAYHQGAVFVAPDTNTGPFNYWVDVQVTPTGGGLLLASFP